MTAHNVTAEQIQAIFGPCTVMVECRDEADVLECCASDESMRIALAVEDISAERDGDYGCLQEWKAQRPGIVAALTALGFRLTEE
jgi:hypothetical protein